MQQQVPGAIAARTNSGEWQVNGSATDHSRHGRHDAVSIAGRVITALVAGYAIIYFATDAMGLALFAAGWTSRADAVLISTNILFLIAPAIVIWVFAVRSAWKAVCVPFAAAALLMALAELVRP